MSIVATAEDGDECEDSGRELKDRGAWGSAIVVVGDVEMRVRFATPASSVSAPFRPLLVLTVLSPPLFVLIGASVRPIPAAPTAIGGARPSFTHILKMRSTYCSLVQDCGRNSPRFLREGKGRWKMLIVRKYAK